jgi:ABC-type branched-subunit amino acid transport system permease subunit
MQDPFDLSFVGGLAALALGTFPFVAVGAVALAAITSHSGQHAASRNWALVALACLAVAISAAFGNVTR